MKELDWFVRTLELEFHLVVEKEQISYEANELYLDEIDESLIPLNLQRMFILIKSNFHFHNSKFLNHSITS
ncbi:hypothetical protein I6J18_16135 [Peribacillus psychrosaccharolyticus]|uniref:Uncharacterized protein n=1 Tax=Peribacillus psychrosaccharolyticus TaxID=1407 RepID=A0A974NJZ3_PERPY|nr:hypothetical protein [Peribacillus psychrosaccharolyticus]MEC2055485.1 hypothetical protein [Peribacillus psychrosaccharolyticus]MED3743487.1 hypothetical protein [Peribacillus psychrosaccharolyticus]QQS99162.1 hypothetical protein I6J18_16135 [Peribacillus psychrosaccharolyticus]